MSEPFKQARQHGLEGSRAKLGRAQRHTDVLEAEALDFFGAHPYRLALTSAEDPWTYALRLVSPPVIPAQHWGLLVGDVVHALRCALDYIAWQLAGADIADRYTQYPIFETEGAWRGAETRGRFLRLPRDVLTLMQRTQPYAGAGPQHSALWAIHVLDNADKHRLLLVLAAVAGQLHLEFSTRPRWQHNLDIKPAPTLIDGAVLATLTPDIEPPDMDMQATFLPELVFGDDYGFLARTFVVPSLRAMHREVTAIVDVFGARYFT